MGEIAATRKTLPFLRYIDKKAVLIGDPYRYYLNDAVLIKDNHLRLLGGVAEAVKRARKAAPSTARVEVNDVESALDAAAAGADIVVLDNMPPWQVAEVDKKLSEAGLRGRVGGVGRHRGGQRGLIRAVCGRDLRRRLDPQRPRARCVARAGAIRALMMGAGDVDGPRIF